jgi:hypothetical protein
MWVTKPVRLLMKMETRVSIFVNNYDEHIENITCNVIANLSGLYPLGLFSVGQIY